MCSQSAIIRASFYCYFLPHLINVWLICNTRDYHIFSRMRYIAIELVKCFFPCKIFFSYFRYMIKRFILTTNNVLYNNNSN